MITGPDRSPFNFGRYTDLQLLAKGGMGEVYKSYDPTLDRFVALKFIHGNDPQLSERLRLEARALARMDHEHICKVYEVGEIDGRLYIAMQYIPGKTLHEVRTLLSLVQKIKVIRLVAEAIHAAHRAGIIHRDLKPANILMQQDRDGEWIPYVTDFGLAREVEAPGLTASGVIIGSPLYMPPEQARGELHNLDFRSDVYSLGVTLYELLSGHSPFEAQGGVEALLKVIEEDPKPLRSAMPGIPADLETITMKCLEKERERRYDSAKSLADDLNRFLECEPIQATPVSIHYRVWKKATKHKVAAVLLLFLAFIALSLTVWGLRTRWYARDQVYWMNQFTQEVQYLDSLMKYAYTSPLHNIEKETTRVRERLSVIQARMQKEGRSAGGPGHYALARGYMTLEEYEKAKQHLEKSWNEYSYQTPDVAYALGLTLVELHREGIMEADRLSQRKERETKKKDLYRLYRIPALQFTAKGKGAQAEAVEYIEALVAYMDQDYFRAIQKAEDCVKKVPWFYQADKLRGDVYLNLGERKNESGKTQEALQYYHRAQEAYQEAIRKAPSFHPAYENLAMNQEAVMEVKIYQTSEPFQQDFELALKAADSAISINPRGANAYRMKASVCWRWGEHLLYHDQDPRPFLKTAMESARIAIRLAPTDHDTYSDLGAASELHGRYELSRGMDARSSYRESIRAYNKAVHLNPNSEFANNALGNAYLFLGIYENSRGLNSKTTLQQALSSYHSALQIGANQYGVYCNQGLSYLALAENEWNWNRSPETYLQSAVNSARKCIEISPNFAYCHRIIGNAFVSLGEFELQRGKSPGSSIEAARTALQKAVEVKNDFNQTWLYAGKLEILEARWKIANGKSPVSDFTKAKEALQQALHITPDYADAYAALAELCRFQSEWQLSHRLSARSSLREGFAAANKALLIHPSLATAKAMQARLYWIQSATIKDAAVREQLLRKAGLSLQEAFAINPLLKNHYKDVNLR